MAKADALLHPQRIAILRALIPQARTAKQLAAILPTLPQATLYRHLNALLEAGILEVAEERQARGAVERSYTIAGGGAVLGTEDLAAATAEDHFRYFATFLAGLLGEYGHYLERPRPDLDRDGVGYREMVLNLTDQELRTMLAEIRNVVRTYSGREAGQDRTPRLFATVTMPVDRSAAVPTDKEEHRD
ncbi:helix-turn-helix domain-containing protein [Arthrobacter sp. GCM10027362]|uniref:helix-turn-helix domain-containing protein n=1 Tax=Arthrobacter sp. GCM10027362 TaxID=3273379 RepID=UPI0036305117